MTRAFWLERGWYLAWWALAFLAARLWLVQPIIRAQRESAGRIVRAIETRACK